MPFARSHRLRLRQQDAERRSGARCRLNFDFAVVADFDDLGGFVAYRDNPEHRAIVETYIQPIVGARGAVQYEV